MVLLIWCQILNTELKCDPMTQFKSSLENDQIIVECQTTDPELWWLDDQHNLNKEAIEGLTHALNICNRCPLADPCLKIALDDEAQWGVWGGTLAGERYIMLGLTKSRYQRSAVERARKIRRLTQVPMREINK